MRPPFLLWEEWGPQCCPGRKRGERGGSGITAGHDRGEDGADIWLGGRRRRQERQLSLTELVRLRVPGLRLQRSVERQFGQITDAVFDRLEPYLEHEFRGLDESGRQAVIDAVCYKFARADLSDEAVFARADLSDEAVFAADAHPAELIRRITGSVPAPAGLSEAETRLYEMLFAECVEYYVRIVRSLPVFEERAAAELLARTATLGTEVARLLERLPDRSLLAPDGTDRDTAFRRRYLELISRDLDEVELFRRTSDRAAGPRVRLSVTYVSLRAIGDDGSRRRTVRSPRRRHPARPSRPASAAGSSCPNPPRRAAARPALQPGGYVDPAEVPQLDQDGRQAVPVGQPSLLRQ
ncbi:hypothetical protein QFZ55_005861 [Streptomyces luteogriseus]|nr:hypothetical protein [Streptomyces luteogriseus]